MRVELGERSRFVVAYFVFSLLAAQVWGLPLSDFDDGTLQGWTTVGDFWGTLTVEASGGNPGGWLLVTDTAPTGGLKVRGPSSFSGDLSIYSGLSWDEFIITQSGGVNEYATVAVLWGPDGSQYRHYGELGPMDVWRERFVSFDPASWVQWYGPSSFTEVLQDAMLGFELAVSTGQGPEAGLDNITLVPEPSMVFLVLLGGAGVLRRR